MAKGKKATVSVTVTGKKGKAKAKEKAKPKGKKAVVKQNQFRTEYKDRVSPIYNTIIGAPSLPSVTNGPGNSAVLMPWAMVDKFNQGSANGEIDGNQINARFLNMKVELDFKNLPVFVNTGTAPSQLNLQQNYQIVIRQCLILDDISEAAVFEYTNTSSGRIQPAFAENTNAWLQTARQRLYNQRIAPDFLSYERREDSKVRILKTIYVKGNENSHIGRHNGAVGESPLASRQNTPNQYFSFDWKMPKRKQLLFPTLADPPGGVPTGHMLSKSWIPCVLITMERDEADLAAADNNLQINYRSHFTYTDN
ncbi:MAG: putative capsid protein [Cressdnaviricota sp.]|nr:MAG: putative capsid protein [Cressdnaviricota sp.]